MVADEFEQDTEQFKNQEDRRHFLTNNTSKNAGSFLAEEDDEITGMQTTGEHVQGPAIQTASDDDLPVHNHGKGKKKENDTSFDFTLGSDREDDDEEEPLIPRRKRMAWPQLAGSGSKTTLLLQGVQSSIETIGTLDGEEAELKKVLELSLVQHQVDVKMGHWQRRDETEDKKASTMGEDESQRVLKLSMAEDKERHRKLSTIGEDQKEVVVIDDEREGKSDIEEGDEIFIQVKMDESDPFDEIFSAGVQPIAVESMTSMAALEKRRLEKEKGKMDDSELIEKYGDNEQEWLRFADEDWRIIEVERRLDQKVDLSYEEESQKEQTAIQHDEVEREMEQEAFNLSQKARAMHSSHTISSLSQDLLSDCIVCLSLFAALRRLTLFYLIRRYCSYLGCRMWLRLWKLRHSAAFLTLLVLYKVLSQKTVTFSSLVDGRCTRMYAHNSRIFIMRHF